MLGILSEKGSGHFLENPGFFGGVFWVKRFGCHKQNFLVGEFFNFRGGENGVVFCGCFFLLLKNKNSTSLTRI